MGADSLMVSPTRGEDDLDIPMCESPISQAPSPAIPPASATASKPAQDTEQQPALPPLPAPPPRVTTAAPASFVPIEADWSLPLSAAKDTLSKRAHALVMLSTLEYYRTGVREGLLHLAELERKRILLAQAEADRAAMAAQAAREERARELQRAQEVAAGLGIRGAGLEIRGATGSVPAAQTAQAAQDVQSAKGTTSTAGPQLDGDFIHPLELDDMLSAMRTPATPGTDYNVTAEAMAQAMPIQFPIPAVGEQPGGRRDHIRQLNEAVEQACKQLAGFEAYMGKQRAHWSAVVDREKEAAEAEAAEAAEMELPPPPPPPPPPSQMSPASKARRQQQDVAMPDV